MPRNQNEFTYCSPSCRIVLICTCNVCSFGFPGSHSTHKPFSGQTHAQTLPLTTIAHCRAVGSVIVSPEHVCIAANALRQGTWLTTKAGGSLASAAIRCGQVLPAPNLLLEGKRHPAHCHPAAVSVNYCDFFQLIVTLHFISLNWRWTVIISYGL